MKFTEPFRSANALLIFMLMVSVGTAKLSAQPVLVDKVVAQVGDRPILKSEIEIQYRQLLQQEWEDEGDLRCLILDQEIAKQVLILQAAKDSIIVGEDQVELELDKRINYFVSMFGSQEKLEETYGKTVLQMKEEFREDVKSQLIADQMRSIVAGDIKVSPSEVRAFYRKIPTDSLPYFDAEVRIAQIVVIPKPNAEQRAFAREKIEGLRDRIAGGEKLSSLANIYSDDPGSRNDGGYLGCVNRGELVPEFEAAAFRLKDGEISEVVETEFGYHIIEMVERRGEQACIRHILVQPKVTTTNLNQASILLDSIRSAIMDETLDWNKAVQRFSNDDMSSQNGGDVLNKTDGSSIIGIDQLERETYYAIENLEPGQISEPQPYQMPDGKSAYRIVLLKSETEPHIGNLDQDYSKFQAAALQEKQINHMQEWLNRKIAHMYVNVDPAFAGCEQMDRWMKTAMESKVE